MSTRLAILLLVLWGVAIAAIDLDPEETTRTISGLLVPILLLWFVMRGRGFRPFANAKPGIEIGSFEGLHGVKLLGWLVAAGVIAFVEIYGIRVGERRWTEGRSAGSMRIGHQS